MNFSMRPEGRPYTLTWPLKPPDRKAYISSIWPGATYTFDAASPVVSEVFVVRQEYSAAAARRTPPPMVTARMSFERFMGSSGEEVGEGIARWGARAPFREVQQVVESRVREEGIRGVRDGTPAPVRGAIRIAAAVAV